MTLFQAAKFSSETKSFKMKLRKIIIISFYYFCDSTKSKFFQVLLTSFYVIIYYLKVNSTIQLYKIIKIT